MQEKTQNTKYIPHTKLYTKEKQLHRRKIIKCTKTHKIKTQNIKTCIHSSANKRQKQRESHNKIKHIWICKFLQSEWPLDYNYSFF